MARSPLLSITNSFCAEWAVPDGADAKRPGDRLPWPVLGIHGGIRGCPPRAIRNITYHFAYIMHVHQEIAAIRSYQDQNKCEKTPSVNLKSWS